MFYTDPRPYQQECFDMIHNRAYNGILLPMGTGKSNIACATMMHKFGKGEITGVLIFANKGSYRNWDKDQLVKHLRPDLKRRIVYWDSSTNMKRLDDFKSLYDRKDELKIFVVNIEAISNRKSQAVAECVKFIKYHRCYMLVDESSTIKNISAQRTENAIKLGERTVCRTIMTGSPITNSPLDVWSQCLFLSPYALGFDSFYAFRSTFCDLEKSSVYQKGKKRDFISVSGFKRLDDLRNILDKFCYIKTKEQCLDLPAKVYQRFYVEMSDEQSKLYNKFKKEAMIAINDSTVSATVVLAKLTKLRQIACGFVNDDERNVHFIKNNRIEELMNILKETSSKVVIWCHFVEMIKLIEMRIKEEFGKNSVVSYFGETSGEQRPENIRQFQEDDSCRFFVSNPSVGGFGVTLTSSDYCIYFNNDYSLEKRDQSEDRLHRIGQERNVTYIDMIMSGTLDEYILEVLRSKRDVAALVMSERKEALKFLIDDFIF